jgi:hypothetical protein
MLEDVSFDLTGGGLQVFHGPNAIARRIPLRIPGAPPRRNRPDG